MRAWQFSKPKTPGFGISDSFYLSVLSSRPVMPSLLDLIHPSGEGGAVVGFGAPLSQDKDKDSLTQPMVRGAYALAPKERKTVLKMLVLSKEEANFDPEAYANSALALDTSDELLARIRATWTLAQLTFESHDPMVYPALDFMLSVASRVADLTEGVVADPVSRRYLLPEQVFQIPRLDPIVDAREHVTVNLRAQPDGLHAFTLGLQKFVLPEFEIAGLAESDANAASRFLTALAQNTLMGDLVKSGDKFGASSIPFEAREGGFDPALWEGVSVLELLPPTSSTASETLDAWELEVAKMKAIEP